MNEKCQKIESHQACNNSREMFKEINSMTKQFQPQLRVVKDRHGTILTENEEIRSRWKEHCQDIYKCSEDMEEELEVELTEDLESREPM